MKKCPNFRMNIWFQKKGGSDNYEIWCVKQLGDAQKKGSK